MLHLCAFFPSMLIFEFKLCQKYAHWPGIGAMVAHGFISLPQKGAAKRFKALLPARITHIE